MEKNTKKAAEAEAKAAAAQGAALYPGAAIDIADDEKVTPTAVDDRTKAENFNPHTDGL